MNIRFLNLFTAIFAALFVLSIAVGAGPSHAKDVRKSISANTGSDNILMCSTSGFPVETPSAKGCCTEKSGGGYTCTMCSHDGNNCADYDLDRRSPDALETLFSGETLGLAPAAPKKATGKSAVKGTTSVTSGAIAKE
jgi:hypothetical protein